MKAVKKNYGLQRTFGVVLIVPSAVFISFGIVAGLFMVDGISVVLGSFLIAGAPLVFGMYLYRKAQKMIKDDFIITSENTTLSLAEKYGGILSQAQLAKDTNLTLAQAKEILDNLTLQGIASAEVNDNGYVEYHFNSLKMQ